MDDILRQVQQLESKFFSYLDSRDHPQAQQLQAEIQGLEDQVKTNKSAQAIEGRVVNVIRVIDSMDDSDQVMDYNHASDLRSRLENIRRDLQRLR